MRRRGLLGMTLAATVTYSCRSVPGAERAGSSRDLDAIAAAIVNGGQRLDGIPAIDSPDFAVGGVTDLPRTVFTPHVGEYDDADVVDALVPADGWPRAYPRFITVWHEIVNDVFAGEPVSITYCPLTGSTLAFSGRLEGDTESTFGVSGRILNSNLVMFDRETTSFWPQLLGRAVSGPRKGQRLRALPIPVTTTLGRWKARYPNTLVLTTLTNAVRPYRTSPYGDYDRSDAIIFPVSARDDRLAPKQIVYGLGGAEGAVAIEKDAALRRGVTMVDLTGEDVVVIADPELQVVRAFRASIKNVPLTFRARPGGATDDETGSHWSYMGIALDGPHITGRLEQLPAPGVFWFAWYAFFPETRLIA